MQPLISEIREINPLLEIGLAKVRIGLEYIKVHRWSSQQLAEGSISFFMPLRQALIYFYKITIKQYSLHSKNELFLSI